MQYGCSPMNFRQFKAVQYYMKKFLPKLRVVICMLLCLAALIAFPCMAFTRNKVEADQSEAVLSVWQIDSFEGGKGSRADFLMNIGKDFAKNNDCYVTVVSLSADAARLNLKEGNAPDIISYGAGTYGIESYIYGFDCWCRGGYCLLTLDGDFSDVTAENTVVNEGKDNLAGAAALFCGLQGAEFGKSTGAYVKLINGNFKYLLGTQRDVYRLKTRGVSFKVQPVTSFNDLYQNISIVSNSPKKEFAQKYISYLLSRTGEVGKLGMISDGVTFDDEMRQMEGVSFEYKLASPVSAETFNSLKKYVTDGDINMLKTSLK